ncbi:hypothetical protein ACFY8O_27630 [Streptomyces argenteolus]|uniref:Excreted virulence factor EspC (Type VII ESX diderm) n=1 Tax=Streptomyces argenteolus TaxID=67274 RepID=A0ABW6XD56_9ACTN
MTVHAGRQPRASVGAYADVLAGAPERIRAGVGDAALLAQTKPWLDALDAWGGSLHATLDGLRARLRSGTGEADCAEAAELAKRAAAYTTIPGTTRPQGRSGGRWCAGHVRPAGADDVTRAPGADDVTRAPGAESRSPGPPPRTVRTARTGRRIRPVRTVVASGPYGPPPPYQTRAAGGRR